MTTLQWADRWTRQEILNAVMSKLSTQDLVDVRHMLDRSAIHPDGWLRCNADFLRMDWLD